MNNKDQRAKIYMVFYEANVLLVYRMDSKGTQMTIPIQTHLIAFG